MVNTSDILPNTPRYLKVPLIGFNVILWILGIVLMALGGASLTALKNLSGIEDISIPAGLIVLGVIIFVLTIVGCVVAYKEKLLGLIFYTVIILILLVCLIGVGGGAFAYRNNAVTPLNVAWPNAGDSQRNYIQTKFACCGWGTGVNSTRTYAGSNCIVNGTANTNIQTCQGPLVTYIQANLYIAGVAGVVIGVIQFVCMLFSLFLIVRLCKSPRSRSYD